MEKELELNALPHCSQVTFELDFSPSVVMKYRARRGAFFSMSMTLFFVRLKLFFGKKDKPVAPEEVIVVMRTDSGQSITPLVFQLLESL